MRIVVRVTGCALGGDLFLKKAAGVARSARDVQMPARQRKARLLVMVEDGLCAIGLGVSERVTCVALLARHRTVQAQQREARELVIEGDLLGPARFHMTTIATLFQLSFVHIVLRVT